MDRRHPVAKIIPFSESEMGKSFSERALVKGFGRIARRAVDSSRLISEDRDRG